MSKQPPPAPPDAPPMLVAMTTRRDVFETMREEDFLRWKSILVEYDGNVMAAGAGEFPGLPRRKARDAAHNQVRRLGLVEFARELRAAAGQPWTGRPKGSGGQR